MMLMTLLVWSPAVPGETPTLSPGETPSLSPALQEDIKSFLAIIDTVPLKELEEKSREFIPSFCDFVKLDLFYNIDGFVYKDFHAYSDDAKTRSLLRDVLTRACEYAYSDEYVYRDNWQQVYFTEVFHGYYYLRMLMHEYQCRGTAPIMKVLEDLDRDILAAVKTVEVLVDDGIITPDPVFSPFSGITATGYRINLIRDGLKLVKLSYDEEEYRYLYRGSFSGDSKLHREKWAITTMLEKPDGYLAAARVWRLYSEYSQSGLPPDQAISRAISRIQGHVLELINQDLFQREILSAINWDMGFTCDDFIFFSGDYSTAALYGDVIYIIRQIEPRGIPINDYTFATSFYRNLPYHWLISLKGFWLYSFVDRQEYMLPVFVSHAEVAGCDIREERTLIVPEAIITGNPEKLLRRYRKYFDREKNQLFVLVLDSANRLMGTLSEHEISAPPLLRLVPSPETIPAEIKSYFTEARLFYLPASCGK